MISLDALQDGLDFFLWRGKVYIWPGCQVHDFVFFILSSGTAFGSNLFPLQVMHLLATESK